MLEGPAIIEISDEQLDELNNMYKELEEEMRMLLSDFFTPLEMLRDEGVFGGKSADSFNTFCIYAHHYLDSKVGMSLQELYHVSKEFKAKIEDAESTNG